MRKEFIPDNKDNRNREKKFEKVNVNLNTHSLEDCQKQITGLEVELQNVIYQLKNSSNDRGLRWRRAAESAAAIKQDQILALTRRYIYLNLDVQRRFMDSFFNSCKEELNNKEFIDIVKTTIKDNKEYEKFWHSKAAGVGVQMTVT